MPASTRLRGVVLGSPDPRALARFYRDLLDGWELVEDEDGWVQLACDEAGVRLSFQREDEHTPPVWPARSGDQQMQSHLDVLVEDLPAAVERAERAGARQAGSQPQDDVRVMIDPDGHPFCLFLPGA